MIAQQPDHLAALNTLALIALNRKDAQGAVLYSKRAAVIEAGVPGIWFNLFQAYDLAGDLDAALASLDKALLIDPNYVPAVAMKALTLDRLGRGAESVALFRAILGARPALDSLPDPVREALGHGEALMRAEDEARAAALIEPLDALAAAHPDADFSRARAYAEQRTGRRKVYVQQPIGGHFPYLPAIEFFDRTHFPWLAELEARTGEIRAELLPLLRERGDGFRPYVGFDATLPANQWAELNHSPRWSAWFFWEDGARNAENCARCPMTAALLERLPLLDLPGKGPSAMFSILEPRTRIPPHTGSNNVRATVHLPLVVPENCGLRVGAETRTPVPGEAWAFDDTIEHEAWNDSDELRAIFILDTWNPLLSDAERAAIRVIG